MGRGSKAAYALLLASGPAKSRLWTYYEEDDEVDARTEPALKARYEDSIAYVKPGDEKMAFTLYHGYIGLMECLEMEGKGDSSRWDEGIKLGESVDTAQMTDDERLSIAFMLGTLHFDKKEYAAAAVQLAEIATASKFKLQAEGMQLLIQAYAMSGQTEKAEKVCKDYVVKFNPQLASTITGGNSNE